MGERMIADYCWCIKRDLNNIEQDIQPRKRTIYNSSNVHEAFISAVSLLDDLMKILFGLSIFVIY